MKKLILGALVLTLLSVDTSWAFDGNRRGFVLGGGLGFAPVASWDGGFADESKAGVAANLFLGYGWNDVNLIVAEGNLAVYKSDFGDATITQGFSGVAWYHYFGPAGQSFYSTLGAGAYTFDFEIAGQTGSNDPGFGALFGVGYEFSKHYQIGGVFSFGKTSEPGIDYDH
ncbi:MAG: hypothetical protein IIB00_05645, partial [candidate division Zixibacteria bacterium]|nr:hypothetical protein [candidate division Zixibacteria bacterium]